MWFNSFVQISVQLAADGTKIENGRVGVRWGLAGGDLMGGYPRRLRGSGVLTAAKLTLIQVSRKEQHLHSATVLDKFLCM